MNAKHFIPIAAALVLATAAFAGEEVRTKMKIAVVDESADDEVRVEFDSDELGFNLHDMQEGENRSIVDSNGRTILITREATGFRFDVDGKSVTMPLLAGGDGDVWVNAVDGVDDVDVHVIHDGDATMEHISEGVMIVSDKPIDDATRQAIRSTLESAGHGSEIRFIDTAGDHPEGRKVRVIKKKVELRTENLAE